MASMTIFFSGSREELSQMLKSGVDVLQIRQNQEDKFIVKFNQKSYSGGRKSKFDKEEIKRLRFEENLTLGQIASKLGCSRTYVSRICNGK